jgi:zinc protease
MLKIIKGIFWMVMIQANLAQAKISTEKFNVQEVISPKGVKAWLIEEHSVPNLTLTFKVRGGSAFDPADKEGLAAWASSLLDQGAGALDYQAFNEKVENLAAGIVFGVNQDAFHGSLRTITANRTAVFSLLKSCLFEPRFDEEAMERIRQQMIVALKHKRENPHARVHEYFMSEVFKGHPYARSGDGTETSLKSLTKADAQNYLKNMLSKETIMIGVAGDITASELSKLLDDLFGDLPPKSGFQPLQSVEPKIDGQIHTLKEEKRPQTASIFGHKGLPRKDPDYYAAQVLTHILGGGTFSAHLMKEVRTKRGLTYGISTHFDHKKAADLFVGMVSTDNGRFDETVRVVKKVWKDLSTKGPTAEEVEETKKFLTGSYDLEFNNTGSMASVLVTSQEFDLGKDHLNKRNDYIRKVTLEDIKRILPKVLDPSKLTFVAFGNPQYKTSEKVS